MRFVLIDRILDFEKGKSLRAFKTLSLAEEYLKDHFPQHPVMPGVLMLETLVQAGAWLARVTHDFSFSVLELVEAKNIRFAKFVAPGDRLQVQLQWQKEEAQEVELSAKGTVGEETVIAAKIKLRSTNLADEDPALSGLDAKLKAHYRSLFSQIYQAAETTVTK